MEAENKTYALSSALEDYLETIFELVRDNKFARVRDIAKARGVRSATVTPAMRKLSALGLIEYVKREYIELTSLGEIEARRIYARHRALNRFLSDVLGVPAAISKDDACAMEHSLSDQSLDHLVRFFEFMEACPDGRQFLEKFKNCPLVQDEPVTCGGVCNHNQHSLGKGGKVMSVREMKPGQKANVVRIDGVGAIRQRLLDMGIMPNILVEMERVAPAGDPVWIKLQGTQISLRKKEAESISVVVA